MFSYSNNARLRVLLLPTLFYAGLAVLFALPVLLRGGSYLLGSDDSAGLKLWMAWWPLHAIPANYNLVYTNYALFPITTNVLPVLSLSTSLVYAVLRPIFGPVAAFNLILPIFCTLNGLASYLFFRQRLASDGRALLGGTLIAFNPLTYELASHGDLSLLQFFVFPVCILLWERFLEKQDAKYGIFVALALYVVVLTSLQNWIIGLIVLLPYGAFTVNRHGNWMQLLDSLLWGVLLFCILFLIFPASVLIWAANLPTLSGTLGLWQAVTIPPASFWIFIVALGMGSLYALKGSALGYRMRLAGLTIVGICVLCYLIPQWSPLALLGITPSTDHVRLLILWMPILAIGLLFVLTDPPLALMKQTVIHIGVLGICLFALSGWWQFLPLVAVPYLKTYDTIANDPEDYVIANYPTGIDTLQNRYLPSQSQQVNDVYLVGAAASAGQLLMSVPFHQKRIIGGLTVQLRASDLAVYDNSPLLQLLTAQTITGDPQAKAKIMRNDAVRWRIGYILADNYQRSSDVWASFHQWMAWTNAYCLVRVENNTEIWQARWLPKSCPAEVLHLGTGDSDMLVGDGWYDAETSDNLAIRWAGKQDTSLLSFWVTPSADYRLTIRVAAPQSAGQKLTVTANGTTLGTVTLQKDWQDYSFTVSRALASSTDGLVSVELQHDHLDGVQKRELSAEYDTVTIEEIVP